MLSNNLQSLVHLDLFRRPCKKYNSKIMFNKNIYQATPIFEEVKKKIRTITKTALSA